MISLNLFREMETLHHEIDAIWGGRVRQQLEPRTFLANSALRQVPRMNLSEDADNFYLSALLPGVVAESLDIGLVCNSLTLSGERLAKDVADTAWQRQERNQGKFARTIELPLDVDAEKISAEYLDGELRILLPKAERVKPKRISIKTRS